MPPLAIAAVGAVGSIGGGIIASNGAKDAAATQASAADRASQMQYDQYQQQRKDQEPWKQAGLSALYGTGGLLRKVGGGSGAPTYDAAGMAKKKDAFVNSKLSQFANLTNEVNKLPPAFRAQAQSQLNAKLSEARANAGREFDSSQSSGAGYSDQYEVDPELTRGFTNDDFVKDPGYEFRMAEGQKALERSAAARGGLQSGGTLKALSKYGQDYASNEYGNAYNRFNTDRSNRFSRLSSIAGLGQTANAANSQASQNYSRNVGDNMMGAANAQGSAQIAGASAWGNALTGIGRSASDAYTMSQNNQWMDLQRQKMGVT